MKKFIKRLKFSIDTIKILFYSAKKERLFDFIVDGLKLDARLLRLLDYSLHTKINRFGVGYTYFYKRSPSKEGSILTSLVGGFIYGIDNILDQKQIKIDSDFTTFRNQLLASTMIDKDNKKLIYQKNAISVAQFLEVIKSLMQKEEIKELSKFLDSQLRVAFNFNREWCGWDTVTKSSYDKIYKLREDTTIAYVDYLMKLAKFEDSSEKKTHAGGLVVQLLDDYVDVKVDYKDREPNLFLAYLVKEDITPQSYFDNAQKYSKQVKMYRSLICDEIGKQSNSIARLLLNVVSWFVFRRY